MTAAFDSTDNRLTAYALGELDDASRLELEAQMAAHPELQSELAELQNLAGMLRSELAMEAKPLLTAEQHQAVLAQATAPIATTPARNDHARRRRIRRWAIIGAEVALGTAVVVGLMNYSSGPGQTVSNKVSFQSVQTGPRSTDPSLVSLTAPQDEIADYDALKLLAEVESPAKPSSSRKAASAVEVTDLQASVASMAAQEVNEVRLEELQQLPADYNRLATAGKPESAKTKPSPKFLVDEASKKSKDFYRERRFKASESMPAEAKPAAPQASLTVASGLDGTTGRKNVAHPDPADRSRPLYEQIDGEPVSDETYEAAVENAFLTPGQQPLSTFSIDVDSASYSNVRRFLTQGQRPPAAAVRIEEMINYFTYDYPQPKAGDPFSVIADAAPCPWQKGHYLARIALQARTIEKAKRPPTNLVFLLDVSGSMQAANKLPLVKQAMTMLAEELNERDRIAIVTYAGDAGLKLASTPGSDQTRIMQSIDALQAGGSTNGAAGINLAYEEALRHFNGEGENRVILCTDGDFNVGVSSDDQLVQLIQQQAKSKVFLSIFGFGMGNLKDAKLEKLADKGNGHYGYIDDLREARRVFNEELVGTLYTVAKDVKIQVEFNPLTVGAYRLIGYENRALAARDFNDDTKDAGEIGAGHTVTALYEIVPKGQWPKTQAVDPLKYGNAAEESAPAEKPVKTNIPPESADDLFTVKLRYKQPTEETSVKTVDYVVDDIAGKNIVPSADFTWAASVASFGMHLKQSSFKGQWTLNDVYEAAQGAKGADVNGRRREFLDLVQAAKRLTSPAAR